MVTITGRGVAIGGIESPAELLAPGTRHGSTDPAARLKGRGVRYKDRATRLAICAAVDALAEAGVLGPDGECGDGERMGVVVSSNFGNVDTVCEAVSTIAAESSAGMSPMTLPSAASNVIASWLAIRFGLRGPGFTFCNGPTSGLDAVHWARLMIIAGRVDRMLVAGVEPDNAAVRWFLPAGTFDGAAAVVIEKGSWGTAKLGEYRRAATPDEAVADLSEQCIGLRCADKPSFDDVATLDLNERLGICSGALGVLQCVAAATWMSMGGTGDALLVAGGGDPAGDDAAAALRLMAIPPGSDRS